MNRTAAVFCFASAASLAVAFAPAPPPNTAPPANVTPTRVLAGGETLRTAAFARFIGEWKFDGHWESGEELHARSVCEWGLNHKHIRGRTYVQRAPDDQHANGLHPAEKEYQRYETLFSWHDGKKSLVCYTFAYDGGIREERIETSDGKVFHFGLTAWDDATPSNLHQTIEFTDDDTYLWTVEMKSPGKDGAGEWQRLIKGTWKRTAEGA